MIKVYNEKEFSADIFQNIKYLWMTNEILRVHKFFSRKASLISKTENR